MAIPPRLPTIRKRGRPGVNTVGLAAYNNAMLVWRKWIEYAVNVDGSGPVKVSRTTTGNIITADLRSVQLIKMVVTTEIGRKSSGICGFGQAKPALFNESTGELTADTSADAAKIYSDDLDKRVKVGAVITVMKWAEVLWVIRVDSCGNLED